MNLCRHRLFLMGRFIFILIINFLLLGISHAQKSLDLNSLLENFAKQYRALDIPYWELDFRNNLKQIPGAGVLKKREDFFTFYLREAKSMQPESKAEQIQRDHLIYIAQFQIELIRLQKSYPGNKAQATSYISIDSVGVNNVFDGGSWYRFLIRKYTSLDLSPDSVYNYGMLESRHFYSLYKARCYQKDNTVNSSTSTDIKSIDAFYKEVKKIVRRKISAYFKTDHLPGLFRLSFRPIIPSQVNSPPGYYMPKPSENDTAILYYNYWKEQSSLSDAGWMFLHEGVPGHHYQYSWEQALDHSPLHSLVQGNYNGLFEGWACYVEQFGYQLGLYEDPSMECAYLKWNLIRSMRLSLDVGLNNYGWNLYQAREFWDQFLPADQVLREREIERCLRWPGQVLSYKIGASFIKELQTKYLHSGNGKTIRDFHEWFLNEGTIPLQLFRNLIPGN